MTYFKIANHTVLAFQLHYGVFIFVLRLTLSEKKNVKCKSNNIS